jgi:transcriptional regulator with XRE-family HTH domain
MSFEPHPVCRQLRSLRKACGWSLPQAEQHIGVPGMVLGTYERGDRNPPLMKLEEILNSYGYTLAAIPKDFDAVRLTGSMVAELRNIANQLELQTMGDKNT